MLTLLARVDANAEIGIGHAMRCLALGEACLLAGGRVDFVSAFPTPALERRALERGIGFHCISTVPGSEDDARQLIELARQRSNPTVVLDGYVFGYPYQRAVKLAGLNLLCVDDYGHAGQYCADIILNQNLWATEQMYQRREPGTQLLLGSRYVLLRREFLNASARQREIPAAAAKILVTLGGGDAHNVTLKIVEALAVLGMEGMNAIVVAGPTNSHAGLLRSVIDGICLPIKLLDETDSMSELMAWADLAIAAAGSTCWELAVMGVPTLAVVTAGNQQPCVEALGRMGIVRSLGSYQTLDVARVAHAIAALAGSLEERKAMSARSRELVDGQGAQNVISVLGG
jgi:UDP-2,4-diacetamido-2,4,6-trideoxy-beta-L-altropyranose hydrolase